MNLSGRSERNRKQDVYFQYIRSALPVSVISKRFHSYMPSPEHLVNTKTSFRNEHSPGVQWPVVKESTTRRPSLLRLDSQGESSKNDWVQVPRAQNTSSRNVRTLSLFSDVVRRFADTHEKQSTAVRYRKPEPVKPYDSSLNITSAVKLLCEKNDIVFPCHQNKALTSTSDNAVLFNMHPLQYCSPCMPSSISEGNIVCHAYPKPVESVSSLLLQPEERLNDCQELQYDFQVALLRSLTAIPLPSVVDVTDCASAFKQDQLENRVCRQSLASCRSSDAVDNACRALDTRWVHRQIRQPRYNCRRKWFHRNVRYRKPSSHFRTNFCAAIDGSSSDCDVLNSDIDSNKCSDSIRENKVISNDDRDAEPQYFSSVRDPVTSSAENDAIWINHCYSELSFQSPLCNVQETLIQESRSFASLFFVSGKEIDSSDFCSSDSDESDCSGFLSPSSACRTDDILADALLSELPCIHVPFTDNWVTGFGDCTPASFDSDFEVYFEEDRTLLCSDNVVCEYSGRVPEANARWNAAYSFPADVLFETHRHQERMVCMHDVHVHFHVQSLVFNHRIML